MNKNEDQIRLQSLIAGDDEVFTAIYQQYWESLFKYAMRILSDQDLAADVVQETFITFWELCGKLDKVRSIKSYLFIMARNLAFKRFREQLRRSEIEDKLVEFYSSSERNTEWSIAENELSALLDAEIEKLPERMREVFLLSRKEHLSYKEIAERLNISDQTVKKQIYNSLKQLRLKIDKEYIPYLALLLFSDFL